MQAIVGNQMYRSSSIVDCCLRGLLIEIQKQTLADTAAADARAKAVCPGVLPRSDLLSEPDVLPKMDLGPGLWTVSGVPLTFFITSLILLHSLTSSVGHGLVLTGIPAGSTRPMGMAFIVMSSIQSDNLMESVEMIDLFFFYRPL